jgi:hypothetical protein
LIIQNRVWKVDRLEMWGWKNCGLFKLCENRLCTFYFILGLL